MSLIYVLGFERKRTRFGNPSFQIPKGNERFLLSSRTCRGYEFFTSLGGLEACFVEGSSTSAGVNTTEIIWISYDLIWLDKCFHMTWSLSLFLSFIFLFFSFYCIFFTPLFFFFGGLKALIIYPALLSLPTGLCRN